MTKGEARKARKQQRHDGYVFERSESGHLEAVLPRSKRQEYRHACRMDRWARAYLDSEGQIDYPTE